VNLQLDDGWSIFGGTTGGPAGRWIERRSSPPLRRFWSLAPYWPATPPDFGRPWLNHDGRKPWNSINFMVAHDGVTLRDLYSYQRTGRFPRTKHGRTPLDG
jgi:hypothetical protein